MVSDTGQELTETSEIRKVAVQFYKKLYTADLMNEKMIASSFFEGLPKLDDESNESLKLPLTVQELYTEMMSMENGKSTGIDGLPIEFYKTFWAILGEDLLSVFDESLIKGFLPLSCRRAVITLLPKKGDLQNIKNWRPVSLLCSEYKILSKALATRINKIIGKVIHYDQMYCTPKRSIFDNITLIRDVLEVSVGLLWQRDGLKYLGVFLGSESFLQKNWEGMADKVIGRGMEMEMAASSIVFQRTHTHCQQSCCFFLVA